MSVHSTVFMQTSTYRDQQRAERAALFHGQWIELNTSRDELIEHKSIQLDKEITNVAVIHFAMDFNKQELLQQVVERAKAASSGQLRILYVRKIKLDGERERAMDEGEERESMTQILNWLPHGSLAIPSTDTKRLLLIQYRFFDSSAKEELVCFMADVGVDDKGLPTLKHRETIKESNISADTKGEVSSKEYKKNILWSEGSVSSEETDTNSSEDEIRNCVKLMRDWKEGGASKSPPRHAKSMWRMFAQALKKNNIHYFLHPNRGKVNLDQLEGKAIGLLVCGFLEDGEFPLFQPIFRSFEHVDQFDGVYIPIQNSYSDFGFGTYKRRVQNIPWASLLDPKVVNANVEECLILFDPGGNIINNDVAFPLIMAWGSKAYPFTQLKMKEVLFNMQNKSSLEVLLEDMTIMGGRKESTNCKLTFVYAEPLSQKLKLKSKLEKLVQLSGKFEILYVGSSSLIDEDNYTEAHQHDYEEAILQMHWPKLSFWDMVKFWHRCRYFRQNEMREELNIFLTLQSLVNHVYNEEKWLTLLDNNGMVIATGKKVVEMTCESNKTNADLIDIMMKVGLIDPKV
ncbi:hypothetical protein KI387_027919 [Taxus chinensis]|uniref:Uncharacterized protein n=1 Tax=Taxus chinensis TaxID=29808 RepID=A0AA38G0W7_TAXCH|nr:hypothetical protein KI387_027919 [Taxus chinensis]